MRAIVPDRCVDGRTPDGAYPWPDAQDGHPRPDFDMLVRSSLIAASLKHMAGGVVPGS